MDTSSMNCCEVDIQRTVAKTVVSEAIPPIIRGLKCNYGWREDSSDVYLHGYEVQGKSLRDDFFAF